MLNMGEIIDKDTYRKCYEKNPVFLNFIRFAVAVKIEDLKHKPLDEIFNTDLKKHISTIAQHSDKLVFGGGKKGQVAECFSAVACSIATLSFYPDGITIFGIHWKSYPK